MRPLSAVILSATKDHMGSPASSFLPLQNQGNGLLLIERNAIYPCGVVSHDVSLPLIAGAVESPRNGFTRVGPGRHQMWIVTGPHIVVHTKEVTVTDANLIVNEGGVHLPAKVFTGQHFQRCAARLA